MSNPFSLILGSDSVFVKHGALAAVVAFAGWILIHIFVTLMHRAILINTGKAKPSSFVPTRETPQDTFIGRVGYSHSNCMENFPLFAAVVFVHYLLLILHEMEIMMELTASKSKNVNGNFYLLNGNASSSEYVTSFNQLAWYYIYARVGQSLFHWWKIDDLAVTARFLCFITQLSLLSYMIYLMIIN